MRESCFVLKWNFVVVMLRLQCRRLKEFGVQEEYRVFLQGKVSQMGSGGYVLTRSVERLTMYLVDIQGEPTKANRRQNRE
jgi:hypothetical protein